VAEPDPTITAVISNKVRRKTTVYSTKADKEVLAKLQSLTGLRQSQIIRAGYRALLREMSAPPPCQCSKLEQIVEELKTLTHQLRR
jgi:hypothetical protein